MGVHTTRGLSPSRRRTSCTASPPDGVVSPQDAMHPTSRRRRKRRSWLQRQGLPVAMGVVVTIVFFVTLHSCCTVTAAAAAAGREGGAQPGGGGRNWLGNILSGKGGNSNKEKEENEEWQPLPPPPEMAGGGPPEMAVGRGPPLPPDFQQQQRMMQQQQQQQRDPPYPPHDPRRGGVTPPYPPQYYGQTQGMGTMPRHPPEDSASAVQPQPGQKMQSMHPSRFYGGSPAGEMFSRTTEGDAFRPPPPVVEEEASLVGEGGGEGSEATPDIQEGKNAEMEVDSDAAKEAEDGATGEAENEVRKGQDDGDENDEGRHFDQLGEPGFLFGGRKHTDTTNEEDALPHKEGDGRDDAVGDDEDDGEEDAPLPPLPPPLDEESQQLGPGWEPPDSVLPSEPQQQQQQQQQQQLPPWGTPGPYSPFGGMLPPPPPGFPPEEWQRQQQEQAMLMAQRQAAQQQQQRQYEEWQAAQQQQRHYEEWQQQQQLTEEQTPPDLPDADQTESEEIAHLRMELSLTSDQCAELTSQLQNLTSSLTTLQTENGIQLSQLDVLRERLADAEAHAASESNAALEYKSNCTELGLTVASLREEVSDWERRCADLQNERDVDREDMESIREELRLKVGELEELATLVEEERVGRERQRYLDGRKKKKKVGFWGWLFGGGRDEDSDDEEQRLRVAQELSRSTLLHALQTERNNVDELEAALVTLQQNNTAISDMVTSRDSLIDELNDRVAVFEEDKITLKAALRQLQKEMRDEAPKTAKLERELKSAREEIDKLKSAIESLLSEHADEVESLNKQIVQRDLSINETESKMSMIGTYVDQLEERLASFAIARRDITVREEKVKEVEDAAVAKEKEFLGLTNQVEQLTRERLDLKDLMGQMVEERETLRREKGALQHERDGLLSEEKELKERIHSLEEDVSNLVSEAAELEGRLESEAEEWQGRLDSGAKDWQNKLDDATNQFQLRFDDQREEWQRKLDNAAEEWQRKLNDEVEEWRNRLEEARLEQVVPVENDVTDDEGANEIQFDADVEIEVGVNGGDESVGNDISVEDVAIGTKPDSIGEGQDSISGLGVDDDESEEVVDKNSIGYGNGVPREEGSDVADNDVSPDLGSLGAENVVLEPAVASWEGNGEAYKAKNYEHPIRVTIEGEEDRQSDEPKVPVPPPLAEGLLSRPKLDEAMNYEKAVGMTLEGKEGVRQLEESSKAAQSPPFPAGGLKPLPKHLSPVRAESAELAQKLHRRLPLAARPVPFRKIRKAFSKVTGVHGFFTPPSRRRYARPIRPPPPPPDAIKSGAAEPNSSDLKK